KTKLVDIQ
ncbi:hypothetical protein D043_4931B, partial [Vibrio parahaemolyticus EKP-021]